MDDPTLSGSNRKDNSKNEALRQKFQGVMAMMSSHLCWQRLLQRSGRERGKLAKTCGCGEGKEGVDSGVIRQEGSTALISPFRTCPGYNSLFVSMVF